MTTTISRVYENYLTVENVCQDLRNAGLGASHIGVVASNAEGWHRPDGRTIDPAHDKDRDGRDDRAEGAATGGGLGAILGGAAGAAVGLGMIAIPGVGPVVAAGWLAALASGAVGGGVAGGLIGALVESGTSKENAELYVEAVRRGGAIVTAKMPDSEVGRYSEIMDRHALNVTSREAAYRDSGWNGYDPDAPVYDVEQIRRERETYRL
jgi:hypothetical protein